MSKNTRRRANASEEKSNNRLNSVDRSFKNHGAERKDSKLPGAPLVLLAVLVLSVIGFSAIDYVRGERALGNRKCAGSPGAPLPVASPPTIPANAPSKENIYAGSSLISTVEPFRDTPDDLAVWRPSAGTWYVLLPSGGFTTANQPARRDGDGSFLLQNTRIGP